jgi:hypothetical protein
VVTAIDIADVLRIYRGSDGEATRALYDCLGKLGAEGEVAVNLFRACKSSERAKVYRGGRNGYRGAAYDRKQWSMDNLAKILVEHAEALGLRWGWGCDAAQDFHRDVLYVDLPTGQVSFHTAGRGVGPDYPDQWDGRRGQSADRICRWVARLLVTRVDA